MARRCGFVHDTTQLSRDAAAAARFVRPRIARARDGMAKASRVRARLRRDGSARAAMGSRPESRNRGHDLDALRALKHLATRQFYESHTYDIPFTSPLPGHTLWSRMVPRAAWLIAAARPRASKTPLSNGRRSTTPAPSQRRRRRRLRGRCPLRSTGPLSDPITWCLRMRGCGRRVRASESAQDDAKVDFLTTPPPLGADVSPARLFTGNRATVANPPL